MCSPRLYAAKLNSMPKLEFAISESPTRESDQPPGRVATRCQLAHLSPPVPPPFLVPPCYMSLISGIDRKYKVVIPELMYLTLVVYRKVPLRSAKWIREREVDCRIPRAKDLPLSPSCHFFFLFLFLQLANLREKQKQAGMAAAPCRLPPDRRGEVA